MKYLASLILSVLCAVSLFAQQPLPPSNTIAAKTTGMQKYSGFFTFYWDAKTDKVWLEVERDRLDQEFLYVVSLPQGVGSNDIGLDRGQLSNERVVRLERHGPKLLLVQPNYAFRAITGDPLERRAVQESFAQSVLAGFRIEAEDGGRMLVDASAFLLRDAHGVVNALRRTGQGSYAFSGDQSAMYLPHTKSFPQNTEFEITATFTGDPQGRFIQDVTPTPQVVSVREHHSFVQLPLLVEQNGVANGFLMREFDARSGYFPMSYMDFATPISEPIVKRFITRHRLQKKDPNAARSEAVKPIVYYLDNGTPEPIRSALLEGASWWNQAFEAAGFINAFQVKVLPDSADPMDVRYNLIQWVHRATRGWSYGSSVSDPRTGEILKGHVTLGSLRVRQDYLIAEGLLAPYEEGAPVLPAMQQMALARLRQLAAHEVGHTLGLAHNFAASTLLPQASAGGRVSVMDYPHPLIKKGADGKIDLSDAYARGIGEWDKISIVYGYGEFPKNGEKQALKGILDDAHKRGMYFITDEDSRPAGGAHPASHLWDNGANAVDELSRVMNLRNTVLSRFGEKNIRSGAPMASLDEMLVPMYFLHRYQTEAASKVLGGVDYRYTLRGDGQKIAEIVAPDEQRRALDALLSTLNADTLALPEQLLKLIPPHAFGIERTRESFKSRTGLTFDALAAPEAASGLTLGLLLHPERTARLVEQNARDKRYPSLSEVVDKLLAATWKTSVPTNPYKAEVQRTVNATVLNNLMQHAQDEDASAQARAITMLKLDELKTWLDKQLKTTKDDNIKAASMLAFAQIGEFLKTPKQVKIPKPLAVPPGQPIGSTDECGWALPMLPLENK